MQPIRPRRFSAQRTLLRSGERTRLHVQGRVAVRFTLPLDGERTGQCVSHCHSTSSVPRWYAQGRVAVPLTRNCTLGAEWQCHSHCHSMVSVPRRYAQGRVAVPLTRNCTLGAEWQCVSHCHSTSSVPRRYVQGRVAVWVRVTFGPTGAAPMPRRASSERAQTLPKTVLPPAAGGLLAEESLGR